MDNNIKLNFVIVVVAAAAVFFPVIVAAAVAVLNIHRFNFHDNTGFEVNYS